MGKKRNPPVPADNRAAAIQAYRDIMKTDPIRVVQVPGNNRRVRVSYNGSIAEIDLNDYVLLDFSASVVIGIHAATSTLYYAE